MPELSFLAKGLILFGLIMIVIGGIILLADKIPWLGKLPGDIYIQKKNFGFYFPLATCLLISLLLTLILNLWLRK